MLAVRVACLVSLAAVAAAQWCPAIAQEPGRSETPSKSSRGLDQRLLEDLNSIPRKPPPRRADSEIRSTSDLLAEIAERMRTVERRIAGRDTASATQESQQQIVDAINRLLKQSPQAAGSPAAADNMSTAENAPTPSGNETSLPRAAAARGTVDHRISGEVTRQDDVNEWLSRMWGQLPHSVRNQMQAPQSEQFLPKYERLIEAYYMRLAEVEHESR